MYPRLILRLVLALLLAAHPAFACTPPSVDVAVAAPSTAVTPNVTITTHHANEIIVYDVVLLSNGSNAVPPAVTGISDTAGLTWARRSRQTFTSSCSSFCWPGNRNSESSEFWWAFSAGVLTGDVITPSFAFAPTAFQSGGALGVTGVTSSTAPWDSNGFLPATNNGQIGTSTIVMSTSHHADLLITSCGNMVAGGPQCSNTTPPPWAALVMAARNTLGGALIADLYYKPIIPLQATQPEFADSSTGQWMTTGDALIGDDTGCTSPGVSAIPQVWINQ